eukprot:1656540-Alexandrium_andersonii.AAC.1
MDGATPVCGDGSHSPTQPLVRPAENTTRTMGVHTKQWITRACGQQAAAGATMWNAATADNP